MSSGASNKLAGKVAVVTASTDGIGFAIARRLAQDGAKVIISSRRESNVASAVQQLQKERLDVAGVVCHVARKEHRKSLFEEAFNRFGGIDILISNAAIVPMAGPVLNYTSRLVGHFLTELLKIIRLRCLLAFVSSFYTNKVPKVTELYIAEHWVLQAVECQGTDYLHLHCTEEAWDKIFEVNVKAAFLLSKEVVPYMEKRGGGSIVYISSVAGLQPHNGLGAYAVSKTALLGLTKAAALNLATDNIRVNCIAPGIIKTKMANGITQNESISELALQMIPMQRFGEPKEIAGLASFLCSSDASYITGETFAVCGGLPTRL